MANNQIKLAAIGECMLEFFEQGPDTFHLGFAGDVYNMAVYFAHSVGARGAVDFISAVGDDGYSEEMLAKMQSYSVNTAPVLKMPGQMPGLYLVETDDKGERDFHYYRSQSAAKKMFDGQAGSALLETLFDYDCVYFSGITLAILSAEGREKLLATLSALKQAEIKIAFDTNFRAKLWPDVEKARVMYELVLPFIDILLPSFDDLTALYQMTSLENTLQRFVSIGVLTCVVTHGGEGYTLATNEHCDFYPIEAVHAVDTTGAGDSFNGAFLAEFLTGQSAEGACQCAVNLAKRVVMQQGAIIKFE